MPKFNPKPSLWASRVETGAHTGSGRWDRFAGVGRERLTQAHRHTHTHPLKGVCVCLMYVCLVCVSRDVACFLLIWPVPVPHDSLLWRDMIAV